MPSLTDFKNSFKGDLARQNRFNVLIPVPPKVVSSTSVDTFAARQLAFRCENAQLPGRTLATTEQKTYGPIQKLPYLTTYNDIDLTLIVESAMSEKKIFDSWLEIINPTQTNDFSYRKDYDTILTINQYNTLDDLTYSVQLFEAYPISINQLDLDWSSDGFHKLLVTFAYTYWRSSSQKDFTSPASLQRTLTGI
jgi:hypothetical protein